MLILLPFQSSKQSFYVIFCPEKKREKKRERERDREREIIGRKEKKEKDG